jgi:beta-lactamase class A
MIRVSRRTLIVGAAAGLCGGAAPAAARLAAIEARVGGRLGVAALDVATGARLARRADERFPMCSTFKAMAVASVLSRVDAGRERLDRFIPYGKADLLPHSPVTERHLAEGGMTLGDICAAGVEFSDNGAANLILAAIGGPSQWTRFARSLGDTASRLDRNELSLNTAIPGDPRDTTKPAAMAADLRAVMLGDALSPASRRRLIDWMVACQTGLARLRAGLPADWRVADKTGTGDHGSVNDIAVAWTPAGPIIVTCYLTETTADTATCEAAIAEIGRVVADAFRPLAETGHG